MEQQQSAEPPSCRRPAVFMIGQDSRGNWVVKDQSGTRGGLFVERAEALRFVRSESRSNPQAFVMVTGVLELDIARMQDAAPQRQMRPQPQPERRVA
jgi:hypothetical protein